MFFFDRSLTDLPKFFQSKTVESANRQIFNYLNLDVEERLQTDVPVTWKHTVPVDVLDALSACSHGRCAFCERQVSDLKAYRFRPPAHVSL